MKKTILFAMVFLLVASLGLENPANAESKIVCTNTNMPKNREEARENGETFAKVVELRNNYKGDAEIDKTLIDMINENLNIGCSTAELNILIEELTKTVKEIEDKRAEEAKAVENAKTDAEKPAEADAEVVNDDKAIDDEKQNADVNAEKDVKVEEAKEILPEMKEEKKAEVKKAISLITAPDTGVKKADNLSLIALANAVLAGVSLVVFRKK